MAEKIGYQSGIKAAMAALRKEHPQYAAAWAKLERTLTILAADHDASIPTTDPPPPPPPPPPQNVAPRTYNEVPGGADARFCVSGLNRGPTGHYQDAYTRYDNDGRDIDGLRSHTQVPGLKQANSMDGAGPCDPYGPFPPWPTQSYDR